MSLFSFIESNIKLSLTVGGIISAGIIGGVSSISSSDDGPEGWILRSLPEADKDESYLEVADGKHFKELTQVNHSYKRIIYGDKNYNGGNYVVYYGSEACPHCTGFLFGDQKVASGNLWLARDKMSDGAFMKAYHFTKTDSLLKDKNIKFLMYEDVPEIDKNGNNDDFWTLPWNTWTTTDYNKGRIKGEYIRNDRSARDFRRVMEAATERFGDKVPGTPTVIVYKEGKPVVYNQDTLPGLNNEKQGEDLSNEVALKRFIKYYFTEIK